MGRWPGREGAGPRDLKSWGRLARSSAMMTQRPTIGSFRSSGMLGTSCISDLPHDALEVGRGSDQLEDPLAGSTVEAGCAALELDVEPDGFARPSARAARTGRPSRRSRRWTPGWWFRWRRAAAVVQVAGRSSRVRLHHHDFPVGRLDETDSEAVGLGEDFPGRPSLSVDADEQAVGVETEPYRFEQSAGNLSHGSALVAAGVAGGVDPFKIGGAAVDLDVRKAASAGRGSARCAPPREIGVEEGARRVEAEQGVDVPQVFAKEMVEEAVEEAGMVVAVPPEPVGALGDVDLVPCFFERGCGSWRSGSFFGYEEGPCGVQRSPRLDCLRGGRPRWRSCG